MKIYAKDNFLELLRKTNFQDRTTFTCLKKAYLDFIFKFSEVIDLIYPSKQLRLKTNSKPWVDSETISAIHRRDELLKNYQKSCLETDKDHFRSVKMALQKAVSKEKKSFFQEKKSKRMLIILKNCGKLLSP